MAKARINAMNQSGSVMNYAKMRKVFEKSKHGVSWRRQMAAGAPGRHAHHTPERR